MTSTILQATPGPARRVSHLVSSPGPSQGTKPTEVPSFQYRPDIDGLRAVAVLAVLLYHANGLVPGGYTGVDVFFVISGFLITSLIRKDLCAGTFSLRDFWERRIRRIFPAQAVLVTIVLICGAVLLLPADLKDLSKTALSQSAFLSNVYFWKHLGYFDGPAELKPLLHMWSLAVEEQFYLVFPLLLVLCARLRRSALAAMIALLAIASFALSEWYVTTRPSTAFYLLPTRAWELLAGALLTFFPLTTSRRRSGAWLRELASVGGLGCIIAAYACYDESTRFPGAAALLPCAGAALLICFNRSGHELNRVGRLLAARPMALVGLMSYSLYLWHWPVLAFWRYLNNDNLSGPDCVWALLGSIICAFVSWRYVERPFRHGANGTNPIRVLFIAASVSCAIIAIAVVGWWSRGLPQRFSHEFVEMAVGEEVPNRFQTRTIGEVAAGRLPHLGDIPVSGARPSFLLWGDSHAMAISDLIDKLAIKHHLGGYAACYHAMLPVLGTSCEVQDVPAPLWNGAVLEFVRTHKIRHVLLVARWSVRVEGPGKRYMIGRTPAGAKKALKRGIERTIDELRQAGACVWIVKQVPEQQGSPKRMLALASVLPWISRPIGISLDEHRRRQANVNEVLDACAASDVRIIDPSDRCFDVKGNSLIGDDRLSYYVDDDHLSPYGAEVLLGDLLDDVFAEIAADCSGGEK